MSAPREPEALVDVVIRLADGPDDAGSDATRHSRRRRGRDRSAAVRRTALERLHDRGLDGQAEIEEATVFSVLVGRATARAIDELRRTPGVADVVPVEGDLPVDLASD